MSIRLTCPNGHLLKVNEKLAGKTGLCPVCKARVEVPKPKVDDFSEDAILGIMGSAAARSDRRDGATAVPATQSWMARESESSATPKKNCYKCHQEISATMHICPHCHTYIAKLADF
jgi:hypothetical protein